MSCRFREMTIPLCWAPESMYLKSYVQFWAPPCKKGIEVLKHIQRKTMKLVKGMEHKYHMEWLRVLDCLGWRKGG